MRPAAKLAVEQIHRWVHCGLVSSRTVPAPANADFPTTILVVEDEVLVRLAVADCLRDCGYQVSEAANVTEAKAVLQAGTPVDLVFSALRMPDEGDGFALARWIRQRHPGLPVILTSGLGETDLCDDWPIVPKPYGHDVLLGRIQELLQGRGGA